MGSLIELNDTLQITTQQGFPKVLNLEKHLKKPFKASDFKGRVFKFKNKPKPRIYHGPPVRVFLAHNINGLWLYWGQVEIIEETIDFVEETTSGKFRIIKIFSPEEMKQAENILHTFKDSKYFANQKKS